MWGQVLRLLAFVLSVPAFPPLGNLPVEILKYWFCLLFLS